MAKHLFAFQVFLAFLAVVQSRSVYRKVVIPDPNALCLDGSRAAYYLHDAGTNPQKFVIFEGGGWCGSTDL